MPHRGSLKSGGDVIDPTLKSLAFLHVWALGVPLSLEEIYRAERVLALCRDRGKLHLLGVPGACTGFLAYLRMDRSRVPLVMALDYEKIAMLPRDELASGNMVYLAECFSMDRNSVLSEIRTICENLGRDVEWYCMYRHGRFRVRRSFYHGRRRQFEQQYAIGDKVPVGVHQRREQCTGATIHDARVDVRSPPNDKHVRERGTGGTNDEPYGTDNATARGFHATSDRSADPATECPGDSVPRGRFADWDSAP